MAHTNATIIKYTLSPGSSTRSGFSEKFLDALDLLKEKLACIHEQYPELEELSYNLIVRTNLSLLYNLCKTNDKKYNAAQKEAIRNVIKYGKYFIPFPPLKRKFFLIVKFHLYGVYKLCYRLRHRIK